MPAARGAVRSGPGARAGDFMSLPSSPTQNLKTQEPFR
ncbi:MAG: hypothetical protein JWR00_760 [Rubritepida sp.]|jgi:hypothetical protein|nr:hypothetical protein [Rubritepida sp.]